jgi:hypothetical protein
MLREIAPERKDTLTPQSCPPAGHELWALIERTARGGAPVFTVHDGLKVPALKLSAEWHLYELHPEGQGIKAAVAEHLDGERNAAARVSAGPQSAAQLRRLSMAAFMDLGGNKQEDVGDHYGASNARRDISIGRRLWVKIGAWPWWAIAAAHVDGHEEEWDFGRGLPADWHALPRAVETFHRWQAEAA